MGGDKIRSNEAILLDPLAWKAVGKVEGWSPDLYGHCGKDPEDTDLVKETEGGVDCCLYGMRSMEFFQPEWQYNMHRMIDAFCKGKTVEQYLETL